MAMTPPKRIGVSWCATCGRYLGSNEVMREAIGTHCGGDDLRVTEYVPDIKYLRAEVERLRELEKVCRRRKGMIDADDREDGPQFTMAHEFENETETLEALAALDKLRAEAPKP
jgi:hypothetical protein